MFKSQQKHSDIELRSLRNMAGGLSPSQMESASLNANEYERMALKRGGEPVPSGENSIANLSRGLSMPPANPTSQPPMQILLPNRDSMLGVLPPQGPRPQYSNYQPTPIPSGSTEKTNNNPANSFSPSFQGGNDLFSSLKTPSPQAPQTTLSPLAPGPEKGPFEHTPPSPGNSNQKTNNSSQEQPNAIENIASGLDKMGDLFNLKKGFSPVVHFGRELLKMVTGSIAAIFNIFFKIK
ncbi:MAG TPA: hypothetical protein PKA63_12490 [Oligoflexia bacterium]|nr:hypothetical protein [Oligoflexia bacterium]HMP49475.1 hypothetical protein [Oligoflexia bacterium]